MVWLLLAAALVGVAVYARGGTVAPTLPPSNQLHPTIRARVGEFRTLASNETVGLPRVTVPLVLGVIARETGGISRRGDAGEVGLMQVSKAAWQDYIAATNDPDAMSFPGDLESPRINIRVGAWFLDRKIADMIGYPGGAVYNGLRAYNCGTAGAQRNPSCGASYAEWVVNVGEPAFRAIA